MIPKHAILSGAKLCYRNKQPPIVRASCVPCLVAQTVLNAPTTRGVLPETIVLKTTALVQSVPKQTFALGGINVLGMENITVLRASIVQVVVWIPGVPLVPIVQVDWPALMIKPVPSYPVVLQGCIAPKDKIALTVAHAPNRLGALQDLILALGWVVPPVNDAPMGKDVQKGTTVPSRYAVYEDSVR